MPYVFHDDGAPEAEDFDSNYDFIEEEPYYPDPSAFDSEWDKGIQGNGYNNATSTAYKTKKQKKDLRHNATLWTRFLLLWRH